MVEPTQTQHLDHRLSRAETDHASLKAEVRTEFRAMSDKMGLISDQLSDVAKSVSIGSQPRYQLGLAVLVALFAAIVFLIKPVADEHTEDMNRLAEILTRQHAEQVYDRDETRDLKLDKEVANWMMAASLNELNGEVAALSAELKGRINTLKAELSGRDDVLEAHDERHDESLGAAHGRLGVINQRHMQDDRENKSRRP